jgi:hypothetical protein
LPLRVVEREAIVPGTADDENNAADLPVTPSRSRGTFRRKPASRLLPPTLKRPLFKKAVRLLRVVKRRLVDVHLLANGYNSFIYQLT